MRHPLHPLPVHLPVGSLVISFIFDIISKLVVGATDTGLAAPNSVCLLLDCDWQCRAGAVADRLCAACDTYVQPVCSSTVGARAGCYRFGY